MGMTERRELIQRIEKLRESSVICFLTSLRPGVPSQIADEQVRVMFDHLLKLDQRPVSRLDVFLCSNGGQSTVPWRLVSLFREFSSSFNVLVPYRAYSAATLIALGADEIVMHPFGELGPIDPTVSNEFNPLDERGTGQRMGISVEDVKAYVTFVKSTVGITHEDELIKAIEILANRVHPLALGNVERFISQSRMIATKILRTHMDSTEAHVIDEIVENMASKLFFHGHPINRKEAKTELKLKVNTELQPELETEMWELYKEFEAEFKNSELFNPPGTLADLVYQNQQRGPQPSQPTQSVAQSQQVAGQAGAVLEVELLHAMIESRHLSSQLITKRRYQWTLLPGPQGLQSSIREDLLEQAWRHFPAP